MTGLVEQDFPQLGRELLADELHRRMTSVCLMLYDAMMHSAHRIVLSRGERRFNVVYETPTHDITRQAIDNRHWHDTLAALHVLAAATGFHDSKGEPDDSESFTADTVFNTILVTKTTPGAEAKKYRAMMGDFVPPLPFRLELAFSDRVVSITTKDHGN